MQSLAISWVGLFAEDVKNLSDFYQQALGLALKSYCDDCAIMQTENGDCFEIFDGGKASGQRKTAEQQSMVLAFEVEDIHTAIERMQSMGYKADSELGQHGGHRWIYYLDPEGNRFEIKQSGELPTD